MSLVRSRPSHALTVSDAARISGLSGQTIRRCIDRGWLQGGRKFWIKRNGYRAGGSHRFTTREWLLDFLRRFSIPIPKELR